MTTQSLVGVSYEIMDATVAVNQAVVAVHYETLGAGPAATQALVGQHIETVMKTGFFQTLASFHIEICFPYTPIPQRKIRTGFLSARIRGA